MAPLQEGTLVEAIMAVRGQIDFLWQFFVTVHIASSHSSLSTTTQWKTSMR